MGMMSSGQEGAAPAGWYPSPEADGRYRFWDGARWTRHYAPEASQVGQSVPRPDSLDRPRAAAAIHLRVILSYASADRSLPQWQALVEDLTNLDRKPWFDERLPGGQEWWSDILDQIEACDLFVAAISRRYLRSGACHSELHFASAAGRRVLGVKLDDLPAAALPDILKPAQVVDYSDRCVGPTQASRCTARLGRALEGLASMPAVAPRSGVPRPPMPQPYGASLYRYIASSQLSHAEQRAMVAEVQALESDDPTERMALLGLVDQLLARNDLDSETRPDVVGVANRLRGTKEKHEEAELDYGTTRIFRVYSPNLDRISSELAVFLASQGLKSTVTRETDGTYSIRSVPGKAHTTWSGAGATLSTQLAVRGDDLLVTISGQRWADKAMSLAGGVFATMATSGFALPLVAPSMVGAYRQATIANKLFSEVARVVR